VFLLIPVTIWYAGNFKFGFLLNSSREQLSQLPAFLAAIWIILMVGTVLPWAALSATLAMQRFETQRFEHAPELGKPLDGTIARPVPNLIVFCHLLGVAFTCFAFIVGSVSSVQVGTCHFTPLAADGRAILDVFGCSLPRAMLAHVQVFKSLAPIFSALLSLAYLDSAFPKQAILPVSRVRLPHVQQSESGASRR
jgi:hypothetical protein